MFLSEYDGQWMYRVEFGQHKQTQPESALELLPDSVDPWRDLQDGKVSGPDPYHRLLTFERIRRPASRVAASFGTAKAKLLPYQFKLLLKFLENPSKRLLIADDVGLGKRRHGGIHHLGSRHSRDRGAVLCMVGPWPQQGRNGRGDAQDPARACSELRQARGAESRKAMPSGHRSSEARLVGGCVSRLPAPPMGASRLPMRRPRCAPVHRRAASTRSCVESS